MQKANKERSPDRRSLISALWIVVMVNMVFADILSFITPGVMPEILSGAPDGMQLNQSLILVFAVLTEIPVAMIFVSRILGWRAGRIANTVAAVVTTVWIVGGGSALPHYIFMTGMEIVCMAGICLLVWRKPADEGSSTMTAAAVEEIQP